DRTTFTLEADIRDGVAVQLHPQRERVATQRIAALDRSIGIGHLPEIARLPVVLEDDLLIEGVGLAHTNLWSVIRSKSKRIASTSMVSSTSAANAYVSSRRERDSLIPRLLR